MIENPTISIALLSTLLGVSVKAIDTHETHNVVKPNQIAYLAHDSDDCAFEDEINIYEVLSKAKEYAYDKKYSLLSSKWKALGEYVVHITKGLTKKKEFIGETEYEAVFKACEFILEKEQK